jgi:hypothetical protein
MSDSPSFRWLFEKQNGDYYLLWDYETGKTTLIVRNHPYKRIQYPLWETYKLPHCPKLGDDY